jgi:dihydroflavonol-4-reductase
MVARFRRVFLTGANGFLGLAILKALAAEGIKVVSYTRRQLDVSGVKGHINFVGELDDTQKIHEALAGCDAAIHCAGAVEFDSRQYDALHFVHVVALGNIAEACLKRGVGRLIYVSSHWTIGYTLQAGQVLTEQDQLYPDGRIHNVYQKTKLEGENLLKHYKGRLEYIIVNPDPGLGEGQ